MSGLDHELLTRSATELAADIRARRRSAREVVDGHIQAVEALNPRLNAVVVERFERARAEADEADTRLRRDATDAPPLLGVPCTIKESFALTGMPQTSGLVARKGRLAAQDAPTVARWRAAGAIPLGVTNLSELCMWMESNNRVYGRSNNPYHPEHTVGGSSGGEGAIVGSGASPFGLGADIGGSIRMPAFFNGVFGHKPTPGLVPNTGQHPDAENAAGRYLGTGPLCRRAEDLMPLTRLLAGPDGVDPHTVAAELQEPDLRLLNGLRVVVVESNGLRTPQPDMIAALHRAADALRSEGAEVTTARLPGLRGSFTLWSGLLSAASDTSFATHMADGGNFRGLRELMRWIAGKSDHTLPALVLALSESLPGIDPGDPTPLIARAAALRAQVVELIGPRGVLLYPPFTRVAPRHGSPLWTPFDFLYTAVWNVLELPVTQVPTGLTPQGLPLGVQVVTAQHNDHLSITVALALEKALGGWVPPWTVAYPSHRAA